MADHASPPKIDNDYFWHNISQVRSDIYKYHYPFKPEFGSASEYCRNHIDAWLGHRVLELGCGTGWIKDEWRIDDYTGIDLGALDQPEQLRARKRREGKNIIVSPVSKAAELGLKPFDTILCYESYHAFPDAANAACNTSLLRPGGTFIIVDGLAWLPRSVPEPGSALQEVYRHEIPVEYFDFLSVARATLGILRLFEEHGSSREKILETLASLTIPGGSSNRPIRKGMPHDRVIGRGLFLKMSWAQIDNMLANSSLEPDDLHYSIVVFKKSKLG